MRRLSLTLAASLSALLAVAQASCSYDGYCVTCAEDDAGGADASAADSSAGADAGADAGPHADACYPSGIEVCDGEDNDCNGEVDDGDLAGVGATCSSDIGECEEGVTECVVGDIVCNGVLPALEICDTLDNDCDGDPDDNNPEGGAYCGTDVGECTSGSVQCTGGDLICQGNYDGTDEDCNGLDDDCDGDYDEDIPSGGDCGPSTDLGLCEFGELVCAGGQMQCVGATHAALEQCDVSDHDCDGNALNGFDLENDPFNCGACGYACATEVTAPDPQIGLLVCHEGACQIAVCADGYWDNNNTVADGCEFGPCTFESTIDACNLRDDNCDGEVDEDAVTPVDFCDPDGECADPPGSGNSMDPTCTADGWVCDYENHPSGGIVSTDGDHHITPEDLCDGKDNDCDIAIDETFGVGSTCDDGDIGACRELGTVECDGAGGTRCNVVDNVNPGDLTEICNGVDDNCDNIVDNGAATGGLHDWVSLSGGIQIFAYEASRPDASQTSVGAVETHPCSKQDTLPWTNVRYPEAAAACAAINARLCTEAEWQLACATASSCGWSYDSNCSNYQANTCNGEDYDAIPGGADDDQLTYSGQMAQCYADWSGAGRAYDLSGNAKEWTQARAAGQNPLRGGAYNNPAGGISCGNDFAVADNAFFFPNVGFRCCRGP